MSPWRAERLLSNFYGLDRLEIATNAGPVYTKGGRLFATGQTMDSAIYLMPNDVEFAIFVNSGSGTAYAPGYLNNIPKLIQDSVEFLGGSRLSPLSGTTARFEG